MLYSLLISFCRVWTRRPHNNQLRKGLVKLIGSYRSNNDNGPWQHHQSMIWLAEWGKKSCHTCGTRFNAIFWRSLPNDATWVFIVEVLTRMRARSSKLWTIILCIKTVHAKLANGHFGYFLQHDHNGIVAHHGIVAKDFSELKDLF